MQVSSQTEEQRVVIRLENDAEEVTFVYDLVQSGRLLVENKEYLPLPFRGQFLFKLPERPRPIPIQVGRFEATAADVLSGNPGLKLLVSCGKGPAQIDRYKKDSIRNAQTMDMRHALIVSPPSPKTHGTKPVPRLPAYHHPILNNPRHKKRDVATPSGRKPAVIWIWSS